MAQAWQFPGPVYVSFLANWRSSFCDGKRDHSSINNVVAFFWILQTQQTNKTQHKIQQWPCWWSLNRHARWPQNHIYCYDYYYYYYHNWRTLAYATKIKKQEWYTSWLLLCNLSHQSHSVKWETMSIVCSIMAELEGICVVSQCSHWKKIIMSCDVRVCMRHVFTRVGGDIKGIHSLQLQTAYHVASMRPVCSCYINIIEP